MFGKRVLNVEVYGDQTIYGIKNFKDSIVVPENTLYCYQIADIGTFITDKNYVTLITLNAKLELYATISSLASYATNASLLNYATKVSPTFSGTVTFVDTSVTPNITSVITDYLKSTAASSTYLTQSFADTTYLTKSNATITYATKVSPTFSGTVTFIDTSVTPNITSVITDYLKTAIATSTYLTHTMQLVLI